MYTYDASHSIRETDEEYAAQRSERLTASELVSFLKSRHAYSSRKHRGRQRRYDRPEFESHHVITGKAIHVRLFQGPEEFKRQFIVGGPINPVTRMPFCRDTKAFQEWELKTDWEGKPERICITPTQYAMCKDVIRAVANDRQATQLLSYGIRESVLRADYCGVPCQIRMDQFNPRYGIIDLKTCWNVGEFFEKFKQYMYPERLAFYQSVFAAAMNPGVDVAARALDAGLFPPVFVIAAEKRHGNRVRCWKVSEQALAAIRSQNAHSVRELVYA
jgi:hypothetical protein